MSINLGKYGNHSTIRIIYISCQWASLFYSFDIRKTIQNKKKGRRENHDSLSTYLLFFFISLMSIA